MTTGIPTLPSQPGTPHERGRGWLALALVLLVMAGTAAAWWQIRREETTGADNGSAAAAVTDTSARAPEGTRIRVRVLNTSGVSGLARRATVHLREFGYDVVDFATGRTDSTAATRITAHTGRAEWAERVKKALGVGIVDADSDSSRYVDLTVFVGRDWRPSSESLRP